VDSRALHSEERRLEESLRASESLITDGNDLTVRKFVGLLERRGSSSSSHLSFEVKSNVAELLLDVTNDFTLGSGGERVTSLSQDLHQVVSQIATSQIKTKDGVRESITLIDRHSVRNTVTRIENDTSGTSRSVQREHSLDSNVHSRGVEGLEHDLSHLLSVSLWVERSLSEENRVFLRSNTKFIVESVMPDLLHVVPVGNDTVLNRVFQGKDTSLGLSLVSDVGVLLAHTDHDTHVARSANNGWEDSTRCVVSGETGFAHSGSIIDHKGSNIFIIGHG
jgi:hypothetical protein